MLRRVLFCLSLEIRRHLTNLGLFIILLLQQHIIWYLTTQVDQIRLDRGTTPRLTLQHLLLVQLKLLTPVPKILPTALHLSKAIARLSRTV